MCKNLHATKDQTVLICLMVWRQIVVVKDAHLEDGIAGAEAQIRYNQNAAELYAGIVVCLTGRIE